MPEIKNRCGENKKNHVLKQNQNVIQSVIFNQVEYKESVQIANWFNKCFFDSIGAIKDTLENVQYVKNVTVIQSKFKFGAISFEELKNICKVIKRKPDYTKLSSKFILRQLEYDRYKITLYNQ